MEIENSGTKINSLDTLTSFWRQKWSIPSTPWTITGFSRAAYRTGFYIPELDIMLDAGPHCLNRPSKVFITHTHGDHIAQLPFTMISDKNEAAIIDVYAPAEAEKLLKRYISALFEVNSLTEEKDMPAGHYYDFRGCTPGQKFLISCNKSPFQVEVVPCDHSIPTVSYCFDEIKTKLKAEYLGLPGKDIAQLKKSGAVITSEVFRPAFAYVCDTSIAVLDMSPQLLSYPYLFIECTFLFPEEVENAIQTKHIHWNSLRPYVESYPNTTFVLIHFSLRYKDAEILDFFSKERLIHNISNIKVWAGDTRLDLDTCGVCETSMESVLNSEGDVKLVG